MAHALPVKIPFTQLGSDRDLQLKTLLGIGAFALGIAASDDEGTILCPFRRCTDGYCPFCGGTRSFGRLLRGDIAGAWTRHPYVVLLAAQVLVIGGLLATTRTRPGSLLTPTRRRWFLAANAALAVGVWATRLVLGEIPRPTTLSLPFG